MRNFHASELLAVIFGGLLIVWVFQTTYYQSQYDAAITDIHRHILGKAPPQPGHDDDGYVNGGWSMDGSDAGSDADSSDSNSDTNSDTNSDADSVEDAGRARTTSARDAPPATELPPPESWLKIPGSKTGSRRNTTTTTTTTRTSSTNSSAPRGKRMPISNNVVDAWCKHAVSVCIEVLRELLQDFAQYDIASESKGDKHSTYLARVSKIDRACFFMKDMQEGIQKIESDAGTPLEWAIETGNDVLIRRMFEDGWKVHTKTNRQQIKKLIETSDRQSKFTMSTRKDLIQKIAGSNNELGENSGESGSRFWREFAEQEESWFETTKKSGSSQYREWIENELGRKGKQDIEGESEAAQDLQEKRMCKAVYNLWRVADTGCYGSFCKARCTATSRKSKRG